MLIGPSPGQALVEVILSAALGLVLAAAAISLCRFGNGAVLDLSGAQNAWQEARNAAALWGSEWRGVGFDPTGASGAGVTRMTTDTLEFSSDWNATGEIAPTSGNPNERLAYAVAAGVWKRGVNGGPRLIVARADSAVFSYRDSTGSDLGASPRAGDVATVAVRVVLSGPRTDIRVPVMWTIARRNAPRP